MVRPTVIVLLAMVACALLLARGLPATWPGFDSIWSSLFELGVPASPELPTILARDHEKIRVAREVVAGRLTLLEAAEEFRRIQSAVMPDVVTHMRGGSVEEKLCRQVILAVDNVEAEGGTDRPVRERLEAELACRFQRKR